MNPTRQTQPYRTSGSRPPSSTLDTMRAGKSKAAAGASLMHASNQAKRRRSTKTVQRYVPRQG